jgi:hypothetical protein
LVITFPGSAQHCFGNGLWLPAIFQKGSVEIWEMCQFIVKVEWQVAAIHFSKGFSADLKNVSTNRCPEKLLAILKLSVLSS